MESSIGVIFLTNQEGDVLDIQADIIGPGKQRFAELGTFSWNTL